MAAALRNAARGPVISGRGVGVGLGISGRRRWRPGRGGGFHRGFRRPAFKVGSMQAFVNNSGSCEDMGPRAFPVREVHKIAVLDIRLANADRHAGNILIRKEEGSGISLVPIDHGYCLPESFEDCTFEWLYWPQSREPFDRATAEYVASLDILRITTMLLKKGVHRGLTAFDIGTILCRETLTKESRIEEIVREAQVEGGELEALSKIMDRHLDALSNQK